MRGHRKLATTTAMLLILAACTGAPERVDDVDTLPGETTPTGAEAASDNAEETVTLRMAHVFSSLPTIDHLQVTLEDLSGGTMKIEEMEIPAGPDEEQRIIQAVAAGEIDLGWIGTRAFAELGVTSFDVLTAPFLIDSYPLQQAVLASDLPERMLVDVEQLGVTGIAVIGGGLRKPFAKDGPLLGPDDYADITFRTWQSAGHALTLTALGATHTDTGPADAIENTLLWYEQPDVGLTPHITLNVNLWPQTVALIANPELLDRLGDTRIGWLYEAAADIASRSAELSDVDAERVRIICEWGGRFAQASQADREALRQEVQPVYEELAEDPETATFLTEIETLKEAVTVVPLTVPEDCTGDTPDQTVSGEDDAGVLNGVYQVEWTVDELVAAGVPQATVEELGMAGVFTWTFDDGELTHTERDDLGSESRLECSGSYGVTGDVLNMQRLAPCGTWLFTATWQLTDTAFVMSDTLSDDEPNPVLETWLAGKPWDRID